MTDIQQAVPSARSAGRGFRAYSAKHLDMLVQRAGLPPEERLAVQAVATVLPFRTNSYVVENLIDWDAAPDDPIYRLVFPQPDMLPAADVRRLADMIGGGAPEASLRAAAHEIRMRLNPHPAGQLLLNAPSLHGRPVPGLQHKYPETVLFFPRQGQTCHAYCSYCFRWAQFVDEPDLKMATDDVGTLVAYLAEHPEVTSVLITGGDPMIMGEAVLRRYIEPLIDPANGLEPARVDQDRHQVAGLLAAAFRQRPGRRRDPPAVRRGRRLGPDAGADGALLASARARAAGAGRGGAPDQGHRGGDPHAGPADQVDQRRPGGLAGHVADAGPDGHGSLLHVRGAGHRPAGLLRGAAGPRLRDLPRGLPGRFRSLPAPSAVRRCRPRRARCASTA